MLNPVFWCKTLDFNPCITGNILQKYQSSENMSCQLRCQTVSGRTSDILFLKKSRAYRELVLYIQKTLSI